MEYTEDAPRIDTNRHVVTDTPSSTSRARLVAVWRDCVSSGTGSPRSGAIRSRTT